MNIRVLVLFSSHYIFVYHTNEPTLACYIPNIEWLVEIEDIMKVTNNDLPGLVLTND